MDRLGFPLSVLFASCVGLLAFEIAGLWFSLLPIGLLLVDFGATLHRSPESLRPFGGLTDLPTEREIWSGARFWVVALSTLVGAAAISMLLRAVRGSFA